MQRVYSPAPNWVDDGAYELGVASYAIVAGGEALVYDTHISIPHARLVRRSAGRMPGSSGCGWCSSHWHLDHVAGNEVFARLRDHRPCADDSRHCAMHRAAIEAGTQSGAPPIDPLVLPTTQL